MYSILSHLRKQRACLLPFCLFISFAWIHTDIHAQAKGNSPKDKPKPVYKFERKEDSAAIKAYFKRQYQERLRMDSMQENMTLLYLQSLSGNPDTVTTLTITSSTLAVLPNMVKRFTHLHTLKLFRCKNLFLRDLFEKVADLKELKNLEIVFSEKTEIPNNIYKLQRLESLNVANNKLRKLPDSLWAIKGLRKVNLMHNPMLEISGTFEKLSKVSKLEELDFSFSQLDTIPDQVGSLTQLKRLDISDNRFKVLPTTMGQLSQCVFLNLDNCNQIQADNVFQQVGKMPALEALQMNGCNLKMIPPAIGALKQVKRLTFRNNQISDMSSAIGELSQLQYIDISTDFFSKTKNTLKEIPSAIGKCTQLHTFLCMNNQLKSIPSSFETLPIELLDLSWNKLDKFPAVVCKMKQLKTLNVGMNAIHEIDENIGTISTLENFQMAGDFRLPAKSKLSKIPASLGQCRNLKVLILRDHAIQEIPSTLFQLDNLVELNLMDNLITTIPDEIGNMLQLSNLNLKANEINSISPRLGSLLNLTQFNIAFNPQVNFTQLFEILTHVKTLKKLDLSYNEVFIAQVKEFQKLIPGLKITKMEIANKVTRDQIMKEEEKNQR